MKIKIHLIVFTFIFNFAWSQNETKKWYFGLGSGLDFTTNPPTILTGSMNALEACSGLSDANGNILLYTNGLTIYNAQGMPMANGTGLNGGQTQSTSQGALILKQPGNQNIFYVFTLDENGGSSGLCYSLVDINLAAGMGSVTVKNILIQTPSSERLCAVKHCNGTDVWLITHDVNSSVFRTFLLTSTGLGQPVLSSAGSLHNSLLGDQVGYVKVSPSGKKLGISLRGSGGFELYDYNNMIGVVSNPLNLGSFPGAYACEFSSDGSKFYGTCETFNGSDYVTFLHQ